MPTDEIMGPSEFAFEEDESGPIARSFVERAKIWIISFLGYCTIQLIGRTLRWDVEGSASEKAIHDSGKRIIYVFWHGRMFTACYFFRKRGIVVMASNNKDGEYMARVIRRFGYGTARGSSSRGGRRALAEMVRGLRRQKDVAFTIDGPRGPRYRAKPGAAYLAWKTGYPVLPFCISTEKRWVLNSWDHFQIPKPFTRNLLLFGTPIYMKPDGTEDEMDNAQRQIQLSLDELRDRGDRRWGGQADT
jgi:lysophospholipid acyltransferase (LPLAT)-like uncharacterized protein